MLLAEAGEGVELGHVSLALVPSRLTVLAFAIRALGVFSFLLLMLRGGTGVMHMREDGGSVVLALLLLALIAGVAIGIAYAFFAFARSIEQD